MILTVISFFLGILSLHFFSELPNLTEVILIFLMMLILIALPLSGFKKIKTTACIAFFIGFLWVFIHAHDVVRHWIPPEIENKPLEIIGVVANIPEEENGILKFELDIKKSIPTTLWKHPGRVRLRWINPTDGIQVGDTWQFFVRLKRPRAYSNPGSFDKERQFFQQRLVAEGYIVDQAPYHKLSDAFFSHPLDRMRVWLGQHIQAALKEHVFSGIITALVTGVTSGISVDQWHSLKNSGTAHLVAISGLHIGLAAGFSCTLIIVIWRFLPVRYFSRPVQYIAALAAIASGTLYALLAGFSVPTKRALIMMIICMASILMKRHMNVWRNYCVALLVVLLLDPLSTLSKGFWLSFVAVGFILYGIKGRLNPHSLWWKWGKAQWMVFLGLAPITLATFSMVSFVSPIANLVAIPWVSFLVVPFSLLGALSLIIWPALGSCLLKVAAYLMAMLWPLLEKLNQTSLAVWQAEIQSPVILLALLLGMLLLLAPRGFPGRYLGIIGILPLFCIPGLEVEHGKAYVTVLDVGQGLATVVETKNHVLVFDTGPKLSSYFNTGEQVILPFLAARQRKAIDALVISHGDTDHAGGAHALLQSVPVRKIITSEPALFVKEKAMMCYANQRWEWDGVSFEMLHPAAIFSKKRNDHSCVLHIKTAKQSVLLTADIEAPSEKKLIESIGKKLHSTVMLVPHHGSSTSSTLEFIRTVNPQYAIIPVGYRNAYGHPKPEVVARYQKEGIIVLETVYDGAISFILEDTAPLPTLLLKRYRRENKRYWHFMSRALGFSWIPAFT